jgi:Putative adhesin
MKARLPMTPGRVLALVLGIPLALVFIVSAGLEEVALAGQGTMPVRLDVPVHGRTVSVSVDQADLSVGQGAAGHRLRLTGTARYSIVRATVHRLVRPSGVSVFSHCNFPYGVCSFDYQVALPAGLPAVLSDSSGDLTLQGLPGHVTAYDGSGDIQATALSGSASITDASGDINGTSLSGAKLILQNSSGDIAVTGLTSADVTVSNDSGDVDLTFTAIPDRVSISNSSGDVSVVLPPGVAYRVSAQTLSGGTSIGVATSPTSPHIITVTDQSGDISITH